VDSWPVINKSYSLHSGAECEVFVRLLIIKYLAQWQAVSKSERRRAWNPVCAAAVYCVRWCGVRYRRRASRASAWHGSQGALLYYYTLLTRSLAGCAARLLPSDSWSWLYAATTTQHTFNTTEPSFFIKNARQRSLAGWLLGCILCKYLYASIVSSTKSTPLFFTTVNRDG